MQNSGVAIWSREYQKLLPGPNCGSLINEIEQTKNFSGGFHPHIARRIFSTILDDWKLGDRLKIPEKRKHNVWIVSVSINKFVDGKLRKLIIFKSQKIFNIRNLLFSGTFSAECGDFNKPQAITACTLSMLSQLYMAGLIPSDKYYRRQSTPIGPTGVEDTADRADSIIVDVPVAEEVATWQIEQGRSHETQQFGTHLDMETIINSTWINELNWGNLVATHCKGQYLAVALTGLFH
jgi:hypothetical protein